MSIVKNIMMLILCSIVTNNAYIETFASGVRPSRVNSATNIKLKEVPRYAPGEVPGEAPGDVPRYAQRYQKYDEFIGDIAAFATENGWDFTAPQDIYSATLPFFNLGERLGWRRLSNNEDMIVVNISAPTILEYAKGLLITLPNNDYAQELRNWCDIFDRYDI
ncbi:MAG: hypothetical protein LBR89_05010, partial [Holosporales bacterium]|nr:hypothetical protein [Holosporales bacterium]